MIARMEIATALVVFACSMLYGFERLLPLSENISFARSGLLEVFALQYDDFSRRDFEASFSSMDAVADFLQQTVRSYYAAPFMSTGLLYHYVDYGGVAQPQLRILTRVEQDSSIVTVQVRINETTRVLETIRALLSSSKCLVGLSLQFAFLVATTGGHFKRWDALWEGQLDIHASNMIVKGILSPEENPVGDLDLIYAGFLLVLTAYWTSQPSKPVFKVVLLLCSAIILTIGAAKTSVVDCDEFLELLRQFVGLKCLMCGTFIAGTIFKTTPSMNSVMRSMTIATPHLCWYVVGVVPMFFAYALAGTVLFSFDDEHFGSLPRAMVTLFCTIFGDSLIDVFTGVDERNNSFLWYLLSRAYFVSFLGLFITNVLNIGLSVMQDSYSLAKTEGEIDAVATETTVDNVRSLLLS